MRGLEVQAGTRLLERARRGVEPTPAARALAHHARLVMQQVALGAGAAVIPEAAARRHRGDGALRIVGIEDPWARREPRVVVRRLEALPLHARRLVAHRIART